MPIKPRTHKPFKQQTRRHVPPGSEPKYGRGRGGRPWRLKRAKVFERDKYLCQIHLAKGIIKGVSLHGKDAGICDHIIPLSKGGTDDMNNLQTICQQCDKNKTAIESNQGKR